MISNNSVLVTRFITSHLKRFSVTLSEDMCSALTMALNSTSNNSTLNATSIVPDPDFAMSRGVDITLAIISILNLGLQIPGIHFLNKERIQHLYIMGLSLSEVLICIVRFANIATRITLQGRIFSIYILRDVFSK